MRSRAREVLKESFEVRFGPCPSAFQDRAANEALVKDAPSGRALRGGAEDSTMWPTGTPQRALGRAPRLHTWAAVSRWADHPLLRHWLQLSRCRRGLRAADGDGRRRVLGLDRFYPCPEAVDHCLGLPPLVAVRSSFINNLPLPLPACGTPSQTPPSSMRPRVSGSARTRPGNSFGRCAIGRPRLGCRTFRPCCGSASPL